jgi:hypothetical protein
MIRPSATTSMEIMNSFVMLALLATLAMTSVVPTLIIME